MFPLLPSGGATMRHSPPLGSAKTVLRRMSWTARIEAARRVRLAGGRMSIGPAVLHAQGLRTLASGRSVWIVPLLVS